MGKMWLFCLSCDRKNFLMSARIDKKKKLGRKEFYRMVIADADMA